VRKRFEGENHAVSSTARGVQASLGDRSVELAAELAEGWLPIYYATLSIWASMRKARVAVGDQR
jgi:alkanesulfonate monooxygenase SsuD/methylene tetrahydromethanopterin reductase-like flavin-dependent oxidoreductase (luciferase family)